MKKIGLIALIPLVLMITSMLTPMAFATQPPVEEDIYYTGTIGWGPRRADTVRAYDTGSGELIFNSYDTLIGWDKERYWEFEPLLATNVPEREELTQDFIPIPYYELIFVRNETALPPDWILHPECTWWEDDMAAPIDSYHLFAWEDTNTNLELDHCDWVYMNAFWWAPTIEEEVYPKGCQWWHVVDVVWDDVRGLWILILEKDVPPTPVDECTWLQPIPPYNIDPTRLYHINAWVDNNPDEVLDGCDVIYIMEYENVTVYWEYPKVEGWMLVPVTKRTWHVIDIEYDGTPVLHLHRFYYDFEIRVTDDEGNPIYFVNGTGDVVDTFDIYDAEYSFKRGLVQDQYGSPMWMFYKPFFDQMNSDYWDTGDPADAIELAWLIKDAVEIVSLDPPTLRINVGMDFPHLAFLQILANSWSSMNSKDWLIDVKGCWDGDLFLDMNQNCYPDWWVNWRHILKSPVHSPKPENYAGTGPYYVSAVRSDLNKVILTKNSLYWRGWPAAGCNQSLAEVQIIYIALWDTRREEFKAGNLDVCAVPRAYMMDLLDPVTLEPIKPEIKTIKNISPSLTLDANHFTFTIDPASEYDGTGSLKDGGGIPFDFFNNTYVRKAFAYAFNWSNYIHDAYYDEALDRKNPLVYGLVPNYYDKDYYGVDIVPGYYESLEMAQQQLQAAAFIVDGTPTNVWTTGFTLKAAYNTGNEQRRIAIEMVAAFFSDLSTYEGRTGDPFTIEIVEIDWPTYLDLFEAFQLPFWTIGWLADYADADNWMRPYMHSWGDFAYFQNYTADNGWAYTLGPNLHLNKDVTIDLAVKTPDGDARATMYLDTQWIWYYDCPTVICCQPLGRRFCNYWVRGWYFDGLYPSQYYYHLWKNNTCWFDITGEITGVSDGVCNMRDITYLILRFNAKAPTPEFQDPRWVGIYGYGGVDPYGDRISNMRDITHAILHFNHRDRA